MKKLRTYLILSLLFIIPSGYELYQLVFFHLPMLKERWLFFFCIILFVTGIALPIFAILNKYFFTIRQINPTTVVREAIAAGLLAAALLWFQIGKNLNSTIIFILVGGFGIVEILLRTRDTIQFRPGIDDEKQNDPTKINHP